jgi:DNA-binding PadR family transcriptional regulator
MTERVKRKQSRHIRREVSYSDLIILFFLYQGASHCGYSMKQLIQGARVPEWLPISSMTVYQSMKRLEKAGFIDGETEKPASHPERINYRITQEGKDYFDDSLKQEMATFAREYFHFDIAVGLSSYLPLKKRIQAATKRIRQLKERLAVVEEGFTTYPQSVRSPFPRWLLLDHERAFLQAEIKWLRRFMKLIRENEQHRATSKTA